MQIFPLILVSFEIVLAVVHGELSITPSITEAVVGDRILLVCSTSEGKPAIWRHIPTGATTPRDVFVGGKLLDPYKDRFTVERNDRSRTDILIISTLLLEDSGGYFCEVEGANGGAAKAEIVTLVSLPRCQTSDFISQRDCKENVLADLRIDCIVEYSGNVRPTVECGNMEIGALKKIEDNSAAAAATSDTRIVYSFLAKVDLRKDNPIFLCKTTASGIPANTVEVRVPCKSFVDSESLQETEPAQKSSNAVPMRNSKKVVIIVVCVVLGIIAVVGIGIAFACTYRLLLRASDASPAIRFLWKLSSDHPMVQGVALLNGCLYIIHRGKNFVSIHQIIGDSKYVGKIVLEGLQNPTDIAACEKNHCIYITDSGHGCVWKVEVGSKLENREFKMSSWVDKVVEPHTIAVISGGRVLLAQTPNILKIYRTDGTMFRTIEIQGSVGEPQHAVRTPHGTFIVSHGSKYDREHRVLEVSAKGQILRSFGNKRGEKDIHSTETSPLQLRLSHPRHLAIDNSGRVLVVDRKNNRIIRLYKTLTLIETFPCPGAVNTPVRLCCHSGRFVIGRGDATYIYSIDDNDDDDNKSQSSTAKNIEDDEDSDDYTDDVIAPKREAPERPLLSSQFTVQGQRGRIHPFFDDSTRLRYRKLEKSQA